MSLELWENLLWGLLSLWLSREDVIGKTLGFYPAQLSLVSSQNIMPDHIGLTQLAIDPYVRAGHLHASAQAAKTKYHKLSSLHNRTELSHSSGNWKSEIKVPSELVSSEVSLISL